MGGQLLKFAFIEMYDFVNLCFNNILLECFIFIAFKLYVYIYEHLWVSRQFFYTRTDIYKIAIVRLT